MSRMVAKLRVGISKWEPESQDAVVEEAGPFVTAVTDGLTLVRPLTCRERRWRWR